VVALEPREVDDLVEEAELMGRFGHQVELLDGEQVRAQITSKKFIGALWTGTGSALVNPGRLADGLRATAARAGVRIHEHSPARELRDRVSVITDGGVVRARGVVLATSAYPPLVPLSGATSRPSTTTRS
jgi:glycine/D-amino acid oxidase-like deaminating enzyme